MVMRTLGVENKEVLIPTNTFLATATGVIFAGGKVRLMDTDPRTFAVSLDEIKRRVTKDTVGVVVVHIGGIVTPEMDEIKNGVMKMESGFLRTQHMLLDVPLMESKLVHLV